MTGNLACSFPCFQVHHVSTSPPPCPPPVLCLFVHVGPSAVQQQQQAGSRSSSSSRDSHPPLDPTQLAVLTDGSGWLFHQYLGLWLMLKPPVAGPSGQLSSAVGRAVPAAAGSVDVERLRGAAGGDLFMPGLQQVSVKPLNFACCTQGVYGHNVWRGRQQQCWC